MEQPDFFYSKTEYERAEKSSFWNGFLVGAMSALLACTGVWIFIREYLINL